MTINRQTFNLIIKQVIKSTDKQTDILKGYRIRDAESLKELLKDAEGVFYLANNKIMIARDIYNITELIDELDYFFIQIECLLFVPSLRELYNIYKKGKYD